LFWVGGGWGGGCGKKNRSFLAPKGRRRGSKHWAQKNEGQEFQHGVKDFIQVKGRGEGGKKKDDSKMPQQKKKIARKKETFTSEMFCYGGMGGGERGRKESEQRKSQSYC